MYFVKILQSRCVIIANSKSFNIGKLRFLNKNYPTLKAEIMNDDSFTLCSNNSSCNEILISDNSISSKQTEKDQVHKKILIAEEVEEIDNTLLNTSDFCSVDMPNQSSKIKMFQHDKDRGSKIVNPANVEKICNISSCSSSNEFDIASQSKTHLLESAKTLDCDMKIFKEKISSNSSIGINLPVPVVIDIDDCEESILLENKSNINQLEIGVSFNKKCDESSLNDFMIIDTLPSPSLIDIDHPYKYKKFSKFREMHIPKTYKRCEGNGSNAREAMESSTDKSNTFKISNTKSLFIPVIDIADDDDNDQVSNTSKKDCKYMEALDSQQQINSSTNVTNLLACSCSIESSSSVKNKIICYCNNRDEKNRNDTKENRNVEKHTRKEKNSKKHSKDEIDSKQHKKKHKKSKKDSNKHKKSIKSHASTTDICKDKCNTDDDIIFEASVSKTYPPLDYNNEIGFFRKHLRKSARIYQKRKYSTSETHDSRKKKKKKYKERESCIPSTSGNEITTSSIDNTKHKSNRDVSGSTISIESYSMDQDNSIYAKKSNKISSSSSHSEFNSDGSVVIEYNDSESSDSSNFVDSYLDLTFDNKASISSDSDKKSDEISCGAININKTNVSSSNILLDEIPLPSDIQNSTLVNLSDDELVACNSKVRDMHEDSNDSIESSYSFLLNDKFENYEALCMDVDSNESDDEVIVDVENTDFVPLKAFKLSDLQMCPPISDDIRNKREKLESFRKWELTGLGQEIINSSKNEKGTLFTLLSYNVLSQKLLWNNMELYEKCNSKYLEWSYRWPLLQHEVKHLQPDIITLQEVEGSHFHTHFLPWFKHLGYNCIYKKKTRDKVDGCAIIYDAKKFELIEENSVEFYQPMGENVLDRDNVGLIVRLTPTAFSSPFCVATTHILFNPRRIDVKLAQMAVFLTELDRISYITEEHGLPKYCPTILTGDFNSEPYSPLLHFVKRGTLKYVGMPRIKNTNKLFGTELIPPLLGLSDYCQHKILDNGRYLEKKRGELFSLNDKRKIEEELIKISHSDRAVKLNASSLDHSSSSGYIHHSFNFKSVYHHKLYRLNGVPEVTTFQQYWTTVDYIFYTRVMKDTRCVEGPLKLIGRYGLLGASEAREIGPLPSDICPSDHYPLAAQFLLKDTT